MRDPEIVSDADETEMYDETVFEDDNPVEPEEDDVSTPDDDGDDVDEEIVEALAMAESDGGSVDADAAVSDGEMDPDNADQDNPAPPPEADAERRWPRMSDLVLDYQHWVNPRTFTGLDKADLVSLGATIVAGTTYNENGPYAGLWEPLEVVQIQSSPTKIVTLVIDGQRRFRAIEMAIADGKMSRDPFIPVIDLEPVPVQWTALLANKYRYRALQRFGTRRELSTYELSESADLLRSAVDADTGKPYTLAKIGDAIGRSESWVSKILTARANAKSSLLASWKRGELTEEQFRDLAVLRDESKQSQAVEKATEARKSGDRQGARIVAKEQKEIARAEQKAEKVKAPSKPEKAKPSKAKKDGPVVSGPQQSLPVAPPRKPLPPAVVDDLMTTATKRPPTHDYVKGVLAGIQVARGTVDFADLPKPWQAWVGLVKPEAVPPPSKSKAKPKAKSGKRKK